MINITCERPYAFYSLLLLVPALLLSIHQYRKIARNINFFSIKDKIAVGQKRINHFKMTMALRTIFRSLAWIMLVLSFSGLSWGTYLEPVQKNGSGVSFVFDISYSMKASDATSGLTRLKAAENYASMLLSHMEESSVSVVLAKGEGVTVVPMTEDKNVIETLLDSLSPDLMSSMGTSLGKGIHAALKSMPENSGRANVIWIFTDGEETDGLLEGAVTDSLRKGVPVYIIGFGSERESRILAGDGKTPVYTALRSEKMRRVCEAATAKSGAGAGQLVKAEYVDSTEAGSAIKLLDYIKKASHPQTSSPEESGFVTYEVKPVQRYGLFIGLAIMFFTMSFIVTELDAETISERNKNSRKAALVSLMITSVFLNGCSSRLNGSKKVLEGSWDWYQKQYNSSVGNFLQTLTEADETGDFALSQYAIYDLATTYLMQNENDASLERFSQITKDAPEAVRFSSFYNMGVIAYKQGDYPEAVKCFRNALKVDGTRVNAKINLELSLNKAEKEAKIRENAITEISENNEHTTMQNAVFELIRENDKGQWKNGEEKNSPSSSSDY